MASRNAYGTNQETNEHDHDSDPHPEASISQSQTTRNFGPEDDQNMVTGVHKVHLANAHRGKMQNSHPPKNYFWAREADSVNQLRSGGNG